jgi:hypothetical protein
MKTLTVLVPKPGTHAAEVIHRGSGVVTDPKWDTLPALVSDDPMVGLFVDKPDILVYYEGNGWGATNSQRFEYCVGIAAGRLDQRYPTIACGHFRRDDFEVIGKYTYADDWSSHALEFTEDRDERVLLEWLP